jgi:hypothetical protein
MLQPQATPCKKLVFNVGLKTDEVVLFQDIDFLAFTCTVKVKRCCSIRTENEIHGYNIGYIVI